MTGHALAQALTDGIHLGARVTRRADEENGAADLYLTSDESNEVDALGFDIRAGGAGGDGGQTQCPGVLGQLLAFDEADLAGGGLTGIAAEPAKVAGVIRQALGLDCLDDLDRAQGRAGLGRVQMQR
jgi:hypothetical protein